MRPDKFRLSVVELVLFLLVILIGWLAWRAWRIVREVDRMPQVFATSRAEYDQVATQLSAYIEDTHTALEHYGTDNDRGHWTEFQQRSRAFQAWLTEQQGIMTQAKVIIVHPIALTLDIGPLLREIEQAVATYVAHVGRMMAGTGNLTPYQIEEQAEIEARELTIISNHARAQTKAIQLFLDGTRRWFAWLRELMLASLLLLTALAAWLVLVAYRRIVSPLQRRLVETQAIVERQQKLAHFGELAAVVAHEIRNPLTAIHARLFTLHKTLPPGSPEHEDATVIRNEITRLNRIVSDLLDTARPSAPMLAPMTAKPLLDEVHRLLAPLCAKQSIDLEIDSSVDAAFLGDLQQLTQVLINLIQNAADSIGEKGGTIRLRARSDHHRLKGQTTEVVVLEVEDTGPGIPPAVQQRLFDPFFSTKKGGTGLGLSIAARIVDRHGGAMDFRSQVGRGTTFMVLLPIHHPPA